VLVTLELDLEQGGLERQEHDGWERGPKGVSQIGALAVLKLAMKDVYFGTPAASAAQQDSKALEDPL